jgi:hypothetical protein
MPAFRNILGQTFNHLFVLERAANRGIQTRWLCRCVCGTQIEASAFAITSGQRKSCGCQSPHRFQDISGKRFGTWTVISRASRRDYWECRCDCGTERPVNGPNLKNGLSKSCGCADTSGDNSPARRAARKRYGDNYVQKGSTWYAQAGGIFVRARRAGLEIDFSSIHDLASYLRAIAPDRCPVFDMPFDRGTRGFSPWSPSVDRKNSAKGYVRGNLQIISMKANGMKSDATAVELRAFAEWILREMPEPTKRFEAGVSAALLH